MAQGSVWHLRLIDPGQGRPRAPSGQGSPSPSVALSSCWSDRCYGGTRGSHSHTPLSQELKFT